MPDTHHRSSRSCATPPVRCLAGLGVTALLLLSLGCGGQPTPIPRLIPSPTPAPAAIGIGTLLVDTWQRLDTVLRHG